MADDVDRANDAAQAILDNTINAARMKIAAHGDSETCLGCGHTIPEARRKALGGTEYCADCAAEIEAGRRLFGCR